MFKFIATGFSLVGCFFLVNGSLAAIQRQEWLSADYLILAITALVFGTVIYKLAELAELNTQIRSKLNGNNKAP